MGLFEIGSHKLFAQSGFDDLSDLFLARITGVSHRDPITFESCRYCIFHLLIRNGPSIWVDGWEGRYKGARR
jgi:hypothetical protein